MFWTSTIVKGCYDTFHIYGPWKTHFRVSDFYYLVGTLCFFTQGLNSRRSLSNARSVTMPMTRGTPWLKRSLFLSDGGVSEPKNNEPQIAGYGEGGEGGLLITCGLREYWWRERKTHKDRKKMWKEINRGRQICECFSMMDDGKHAQLHKAAQLGKSVGSRWLKQIIIIKKASLVNIGESCLQL